DTLAAVSPDSLSVANYDAPADRAGARVLEMWGIDSASVAEIAVTLSRQQSVNDQTRGVRFNIPALIPGGAGTVGSHNMLPGLAAGALTTDSATYFVDQSVKWGLPLIPCFNSNNQGNINVQVLDAIASTSPKIDFLMYGLTGKPGF